MAQIVTPLEPTIWALRKNRKRKGSVPSLYEHLFGYDPIRLASDSSENVHKGSAENPRLNIIDSQTRFALAAIASDLPPDQS